MPPFGDESSRQKAQDENKPINPFIAFRQFADDQVSNLMSGILGISSGFRSSAPSSDRALQEYQAWLQEARASQQNLDEEVEEMARIIGLITRESMQDEIQSAIEYDNKALRCPYRPTSEEVSQRQSAESELAFPFTRLALQHPILSTSLSEPRMGSVPIAYPLYSPYSPIRLEHYDTLRHRGINWRDAFEDLLAVQYGKDTSSSRTQEESAGGRDWMKTIYGMAEKERDQDDCAYTTFAALGDKSHVGAQAAKDQRVTDGVNMRGGRQTQDDPSDGSSDNEPATELDHYSLLLMGQGLSSTEDSSLPSWTESQSQSRSITHMQHDPAPTDGNGSKPSILSTLTTTERKTLNDGSVHTKVVLKKRFSDGREESTETMHTQSSLPKPQYQAPTKAIKQKEAKPVTSEVENKVTKSKGWFWT